MLRAARCGPVLPQPARPARRRTTAESQGRTAHRRFAAPAGWPQSSLRSAGRAAAGRSPPPAPPTARSRRAIQKPAFRSAAGKTAPPQCAAKSAVYKISICGQSPAARRAAPDAAQTPPADAIPPPCGRPAARCHPGGFCPPAAWRPRCRPAAAAASGAVWPTSAAEADTAQTAARGWRPVGGSCPDTPPANRHPCFGGSGGICCRAARSAQILQ